MLIAFLAGTLCGVGVRMWHPQRSAGVPAGRIAAVPAAARAAAAPAGETPVLRSESVSVAPLQPLRNLFAYFEPPTLHTVAVAAMITPAQPAVMQPEAAPHPPPFPYRYIGTFGTRENAFAVFARDGEVVNARIGDTLGDRFTLRRIGVESVDLAWGDSGELRVSAAASSPR